jgi:DeoR/GlpR family transcriptional regulator of sugar metabolism
VTLLCRICVRRLNLAKIARTGAHLSYALIMSRFGVSLATAKRDLTALDSAGYVHYIGRRKSRRKASTR